jgi:hypothetical protein
LSIFVALIGKSDHLGGQFKGSEDMFIAGSQSLPLFYLSYFMGTVKRDLTARPCLLSSFQTVCQYSLLRSNLILKLISKGCGSGPAMGAAVSLPADPNVRHNRATAGGSRRKPTGYPYVFISVLRYLTVSRCS